jgi:NitT/TauT family transport system ATP-binding protein
MEISFGPEFDRPLARRNAPEFSAYFNDLWKALKTED